MKRRINLSVMCGAALATVLAAHAAGAQVVVATGDEAKGFALVDAHSTSGNITAQSYGVTAGVTLRGPLQLTAEGTRVLDISPASMGTGAALIARYLGDTQGTSGYTVITPVTMGTAGLRYNTMPGKRVRPYLAGNVGLAHIAHDATFTVKGTDVTANLAQYGVTLGTDLSGTENVLVFGGGAGAAVDLAKKVFLDLNYKYSRLQGQAPSNLQQFGGGIGIRF